MSLSIVAQESILYVWANEGNARDIIDAPPGLESYKPFFDKLREKMLAVQYFLNRFAQYISGAGKRT